MASQMSTVNRFGQLRQTARRSLHKFRYGVSLRARYYLLPRRDKQPLFILARQRTGGNLLADYLNSIPDISLEHEFLNPVFHYGIRPRPDGRDAVIRHVRYSLNALPERLSGCKILIGQFALHGITFEEFHDAFPEAKFVLLYRRDTAKQFVSLKVAHKTKQYLATAKEKLNLTTVHLDADELVGFYQRNRDEYLSVMKHPRFGECARVVTYEEIASAPQKVFDETIFPFLGLPQASIVTKLVKQARKPISETVENYDEMKDPLEQYGTLDLSEAAARTEQPA